MKKTSKAKYALLSVGLAAALAFTAFVPVACSCTPIEAPEFEIKKIIDFADGREYGRILRFGRLEQRRLVQRRMGRERGDI